MKKQPVKRERRGTLLDTTRHSSEALVRVFKRMLASATAQGETNFLRTVFSR